MIKTLAASIVAILLLPSLARAEDFWGTMSQYPEKSSAPLMASSGVDLERVNIVWSDGNCQRGSCSPQSTFHGHKNYFWKHYDELFLSRARVGIKIIPTLYGSTAKYSGSLHFFPKADSKGFTYWRNFAAAAVLRYGPDGVFWKEHPRYKNYAVRWWEVWNEPNLPINNPSKTRPAKEYALFLKKASVAIRWARADAKIIFGGLAPSRSVSFLQEANLALAKASGAYNAVGLHPYDRTAGGVMSKTREMARATNKPLWINEIGWSTSDPLAPVSPLVVSSQQQASLLRESFGQMWQSRKDLGILGVFWYLWQDAEGPLYSKTEWDSFCGLTGAWQIAKPSLAAYKEITTSL